MTTVLYYNTYGLFPLLTYLLHNTDYYSLRYDYSQSSFSAAQSQYL